MVEHEAVSAHRRFNSGDMSGLACRCVSLSVLAVAATCAVFSASDERATSLLGWMNSHYDSQLGYSGLRTIVPGEVAYKGPWSATPLAIPGQHEIVSPYPMPYMGWVHRARPLVVMQHPAIRKTTTTSFSDEPSAPPETVGQTQTVVQPAPGATISTIPSVPTGYALPYVPPDSMNPQFVGMVPSMGVSGFSTPSGYMPMPAYDMQTSTQLQRGYVPIRVTIPRFALPALPRPANPYMRPTVPIMAYDANNVNSGLSEGINDINPNLGLPSVPRPTVTVTEKQGDQDSDDSVQVDQQTESQANATATFSEEHAEVEKGNGITGLRQKAVGGKTYDIHLPSGRALSICKTNLVIMEKGVQESNAPCESLDSIKKEDGAPVYAALMVIFPPCV